MSQIHKTLLFTIAFTKIMPWSFEIHRIILSAAIHNLPTYIREDLQKRVNFYAIPKYDQFYDISIFPDYFNGTLKFTWLKETHYNAEGIDKATSLGQSQILTSLSRTYNYMNQNEHNFLLDTFSLTFLIHLIADIHQPYHLIPGGGLKENAKGYKHLHDYWDNACGLFKGKKINANVEMIFEIFEKNKEIKVGSQIFNYSKFELSEKPEFIKWFNEIDKKLKNYVYEGVEGFPEKEKEYQHFCRRKSLEQVYKAIKRTEFILKEIYTKNKNLPMPEGGIGSGFGFKKVILVIVLISLIYVVLGLVIWFRFVKGKK